MWLSYPSRELAETNQLNLVALTDSQHHLAYDVVTAYENCSFFIDEYEFSAGAINNLMSAKKHLQKALALTKAAEVIIDFEVTD